MSAPEFFNGGFSDEIAATIAATLEHHAYESNDPLTFEGLIASTPSLTGPQRAMVFDRLSPAVSWGMKATTEADARARRLPPLPPGDHDWPTHGWPDPVDAQTPAALRGHLRVIEGGGND